MTQKDEGQDTKVNDDVARHYRSEGWWADQTILDYFDRATAAKPDAVALVSPGMPDLTFSELDRKSRAVARNLVAFGLRAGDVVSVQLPNWQEFVITHIALTRVGAIINPLLPIYRRHELSYILGFAHSVLAIIPNHYRGWDYPAMYRELRAELPDLRDVFVVSETAPEGMRSFRELLRDNDHPLPPIEHDADAVSTIIFTSGTESSPKGVVHSHNTMLYGNRAMAQLLSLTDRDVVWAPSPIAHGTGFLWGMRQALMLGAKLVLQDIWDPEEALRLIEAERCTFTLSATPFVSMMLNSPSAGKRDTSSLKIFASAGAPIPRSLGLQAQETLGCLLIGMWGMTECFVGSASKPDDPQEKLWGTDGCAMPGCELAVFDDTRTRILPPGEVGELATRGPHTALGYFNDPERTRQTFLQDGWLFSNDLAVMDVDGYIRIVGRKKDIINRGGLKVSARELEELLLQHAKVRDVAVVSVPDARLGEKSCAFVIPSGNGEPTLPELVGFLESMNVAKYKLPEYLSIVDSMPMTPSGKVQKFKLREGFINEKKFVG
ncbi:AMP-binding protein [Castellaniella sp.]|uniref:AMP-binding protein n=1 Tax=Castellaniella sp. TaxID=1955812 RepID=UPI0035678D1B